MLIFKPVLEQLPTIGAQLGRVDVTIALHHHNFQPKVTCIPEIAPDLFVANVTNHLEERREREDTTARDLTK